MTGCTRAFRKPLVASLAVLVALLVSGTSSVAQAAVPGFASDLAGAGPDRSAGVPQGYVITPFGYFHPACVRKLAEEETLLADGRVAHADGTVEAQAPVCSYPQYSPTGLLVTKETLEASRTIPAARERLA